jgi:hypothetical protein
VLRWIAASTDHRKLSGWSFARAARTVIVRRSARAATGVRLIFEPVAHAHPTTDRSSSSGRSYRGWLFDTP